MSGAPPALAVIGLAKSYGGVRALAPITTSFETGTITAVVGANGAGKTTFLDCISGRVPATTGSVVLHGQNLGGLPPQARARRGLARLFQDAELFRTLSVREALELAFDSLGRPSLWPILVSRRLRRARRDAVATALRRFNLEQVEHEVLAHLSLGMSRVVALAALELSGADVWLLDEPASGLSRAEVERLAGLLRSLARGHAPRCIVLVEHDAMLVQAAADRIVLLERGALIADAPRGSDAWDDVIAGRSSSRRELATTSHGISQPSPQGGSVLAAHGLTVTYGKFTAVRDVSIEAHAGDIRCLVGTNGAGKSTIMRCLAGLLRPDRGDITLDSSPLVAPPHARVHHHGIVLVAGGRTVFPHLSVDENLRLAGKLRDVGDVLTIFPELGDRRRQLAGSLSGGEQQMLAIARAMLLRPRFLLVDELTLGLAERAAERLLEALTHAQAERGLGVLLVEQDYALALEWSSHAYVMAQGEMLFAGPSREAAARPDLFRPVFVPAVD
jgi:branched-chain amino acid transport system ATP-binding protein